MRNLTISQADQTGITGLVSSAESGEEITLSRHGRPVASVVATHELEELKRDSESLRDVALVMARMATDSGVRTNLVQAMDQFGISRTDLEDEVEADFHDR